MNKIFYILDYWNVQFHKSINNQFNSIQGTNNSFEKLSEHNLNIISLIISLRRNKSLNLTIEMLILIILYRYFVIFISNKANNPVDTRILRIRSEFISKTT